MHLLSALALRLNLLLWLCCFLSAGTVFAQSAIIPLYTGAPPGSENWNWTEAENEQNAWQTKVVYNVSRPSLTVFTPEPGKSNGTAVIICPGGAFRALSINSEGFEVAEWLVKKGVTCFVLKYRLVRSLTADPVAEMGSNWGSPAFEEESGKLIPLAIADGRSAIAYVRRHADKWRIDPNRIGIMGFSAGGTVAGATAYGYDQTNRPDFVAPVYAFFPKEFQGKLLHDAPPAFFVAATDDGLDLAPHTVGLYQQWMEAKKSAELHLYAKGGHGFGMRVNNTPSDKWIDRFGDWLQSQGWFSKSAYDPALNAYERKVFYFGEGKQLSYRILYPENYDPLKKYPLLLFLHGAGERGRIMTGN